MKGLLALEECPDLFTCGLEEGLAVGIHEGVSVYLDESLRKHEIVYPAVGTDHSGVKLTIPELEKCSRYREWVDVCKITINNE